jgi:hypothetical protein
MSLTLEATDALVASLQRAGYLSGEPECHTRLTDRGRSLAAKLLAPAADTLRRSRLRIVLILLACVVPLGIAAALMLKWFGVL